MCGAIIPYTHPSRNTLRVRLYQKSLGDQSLPEPSHKVAILCEYDYIKRMKANHVQQVHDSLSQYSASTIISKVTRVVGFITPVSAWVAILCEYDYIKSKELRQHRIQPQSECRNTLRVRLYQKLSLMSLNRGDTYVAILCEYDYIKSTLTTQRLSDVSANVAILCEYDYIKSAPFHIPGRMPGQGRNTLRVRLYQKFTEQSRGFLRLSFCRNTLRVRLYQKHPGAWILGETQKDLSQYSASTIISKEYLWKPLSGKGFQGDIEGTCENQRCQRTKC